MQTSATSTQAGPASQLIIEMTMPQWQVRSGSPLEQGWIHSTLEQGWVHSTLEQGRSTDPLVALLPKRIQEIIQLYRIRDSMIPDRPAHAK